MRFKVTYLEWNKISLLFLTVILFNLNLMAQKPMPERDFEINLQTDENINSEIKNNIRVNLDTGFPIALYGLNYEVPQGTPEAMAMYYITHESETFGIKKNEITNLRHHATRTTDAGSVVRYRQYSGNYPVNKAELTISISPQNKVVFVMNSYEVGVNMANVQPTVSEANAYQIALDYLKITTPVSFNDSRLMIYKNTKITRLAHEVTILSDNPVGEWHVFVDARTGEIFKVADMAHYYCDHKDGKHDETCNYGKATKPNQNTEVYRRADGTGMVFNPDPLSSNRATYGTTGYVDGNDANTTQLNNARISVNLRDITFSGGTYRLVGPRAEIVDHESPYNGLFFQASSSFNFTRFDSGFEAVNTYYHIDYLMGYINDVLGCNVLPYQYAGGVQFDPHGLSGDDNSHYSSGSGRLAFGEGCVDDAEDSDVIHHELGHGLHDWVTSGGLSQVNGLSEGSGDYVAQSYNRGVSIANGYWTSADPAWNYVFNWDGHNTCWNGRITNYGATYPGGLTGGIHADGQIWASCLMTVWDQIGQQRMDKIFYEGLGMTNSSSNQNDAANAVYQAAINLAYSASEINDIHAGLTACGYTLPALPVPPVAAFSSDNSVICIDTNNTVNFRDESSPAGTSWAWTFEGGSPETSTAQNPTVTYATGGTFDVTLVVTNSYGSDTLIESNYIIAQQGASCPSCNTITNNTVVPITAVTSYTSVINTPATNSITDVNVTINITHTYDADLDITLTSPTGTVVELTSDNGGSGNNFTNTVFDQSATNPITGGSAPFTGTYRPEGDLSTFNGETPTGNWTLTVTDDASGDTGQINSWSLELCLSPTIGIEENTFEDFAIYPNPNNGSFHVLLNSKSNSNINIQVYDIRGRTIFNNSYESAARFNQEITLNNAQSGMYLVKISDGERQTIQKIIIK
jgi:subtilisin-like proprotein convertase family protein